MGNWRIEPADGRIVEKTGRQMLVDNVGALLIIDGTGGDGCAFAVGPGGWLSCTREGPHVGAQKAAHFSPSPGAGRSERRR